MQSAGCHVLPGLPRAGAPPPASGGTAEADLGHEIRDAILGHDNLEPLELA